MFGRLRLLYHEPTTELLVLQVAQEPVTTSRRFRACFLVLVRVPGIGHLPCPRPEAGGAGAPPPAGIPLRYRPIASNRVSRSATLLVTIDRTACRLPRSIRLSWPYSLGLIPGALVADAVCWWRARDHSGRRSSAGCRRVGCVYRRGCWRLACDVSQLPIPRPSGAAVRRSSIIGSSACGPTPQATDALIRRLRRSSPPASTSPSARAW